MATKTDTPFNAKAGGAAVDLSQEIVLAVDKLAGDHVKCTRITADTYRCNWWSHAETSGYDNPGMRGLVVTTHCVRRSRFLRVTKGDAGLVIKEVGAEG